MAKIKNTKNELKAQREALGRYERFLPMLQLKKQQLQGELNNIDAQIAEKAVEERAVREKLASWAAVFSEDEPVENTIAAAAVHTDTGNIAGVDIPVFRDITFEKPEIDLYLTPPWLDDAQEVIEQLTRLAIEREILQEQRNRIAEELRVTSQRVNLFEKVKIPECREHIRVIRIFLGDQQTAAVARGKMAKNRLQNRSDAGDAA